MQKATATQIIAMPGETISAYRAIVLINNKLYVADPTNIAHMGKQVGIALNGSRVGLGTVLCQLGGEFMGTVNLLPNTRYYVGAGGTLSTSPTFPGAAWSQYIGFSRADRWFIVQPAPSIARV